METFTHDLRIWKFHKNQLSESYSSWPILTRIYFGCVLQNKKFDVFSTISTDKKARARSESREEIKRDFLT